MTFHITMEENSEKDRDKITEGKESQDPVALRLPWIHRAWVQSLVRELRSHLPQGAAKENENHEAPQKLREETAPRSSQP